MAEKATLSEIRKRAVRKVIFPAAVLCLAAGLLSGCGFRPAYEPVTVGKVGSGSNPAVALSEIQVGDIPNRDGVLLRQALLEQFNAGNPAVMPHYFLTVSYRLWGTAAGIQTDSSASFIKMTGQAFWSLTKIGQSKVLTSGTATAIGGYNIMDNQYFAAFLAGRRSNGVIAQALASQITAALRAYFATGMRA